MTSCFARHPGLSRFRILYRFLADLARLAVRSG